VRRDSHAFERSERLTRRGFVFRVTRRVYGEDDDSRRIPLYSPGMTLSDEEAERAGQLDGDPQPEKPRGWWTRLERRSEPTEVPPVGDTVEISEAGRIIKTHAARHDRSKAHGAFATHGGRPRRGNAVCPDSSKTVTRVPGL
jgi:hypothetical protein